jgi:hypothetical protein
MAIAAPAIGELFHRRHVRIQRNSCAIHVLLRTLLIAACSWLAPCALHAQQSGTAWENLDTLTVGQRIVVVDQNHKKHSGAFASYAPEAITVENVNGPESIQRTAVFQVVSVGHSRRARNALIGAALGAGVGAGIGVAGTTCSPDCIGASRGQLAGGLAAAFGVVGAVIGAVIPGHGTVLYRAASR